MGLVRQRQPLAVLPPGKRPGTHCIGGSVGHRAGMNRCEKFRPQRDSIIGPERESINIKLFLNA